jgi:hypothetical protein
MTKRQRKLLADLQARAGCRFETVELTGGGHLRIRLHNGRFVIAPSTPSDGARGFLNTVAQIRRTLREGA